MELRYILHIFMVYTTGNVVGDTFNTTQVASTMSDITTPKAAMIPSTSKPPIDSTNKLTINSTHVPTGTNTKSPTSTTTQVGTSTNIPTGSSTSKPTNKPTSPYTPTGSSTNASTNTLTSTSTNAQAGTNSSVSTSSPDGKSTNTTTVSSTDVPTGTKSSVSTSSPVGKSTNTTTVSSTNDQAGTISSVSTSGPDGKSTNTKTVSSTDIPTRTKSSVSTSSPDGKSTNTTTVSSTNVPTGTKSSVSTSSPGGERTNTPTSSSTNSPAGTNNSVSTDGNTITASKVTTTRATNTISTTQGHMVNNVSSTKESQTSISPTSTEESSKTTFATSRGSTATSSEQVTTPQAPNPTTTPITTTTTTTLSPTTTTPSPTTTTTPSPTTSTTTTPSPITTTTTTPSPITTTTTTPSPTTSTTITPSPITTTTTTPSPTTSTTTTPSPITTTTTTPSPITTTTTTPSPTTSTTTTPSPTTSTTTTSSPITTTTTPLPTTTTPLPATTTTPLPATTTTPLPATTTTTTPLPTTTTTTTTTTATPTTTVSKASTLVTAFTKEEAENIDFSQFNLKTVLDEHDFDLRTNLLKAVQMHNGVEVFGTIATFVHFHGVEDKKNLTFAKLIKNVDPPNPVISSADAIEKAYKNRRKSRKDKFTTVKNDRHTRKIIYLDPKDSMAKHCMWVDFLIRRGGKSNRKISNGFVIVERVNGDVLMSFEQLVAYSMTGDGGNIKVGQHFFGELELAAHKLDVAGPVNSKCKISNSQVTVSSAKGVVIFPPKNCFKNGPWEEPCDPQPPSPDATNVSYSQVHDALYYTGRFKDMLKEFFKDETLTMCCPEGIKVCTHFGLKDVSFYYSSNACEAYYGIGGTQFYDMVSPTIVGHELGHALIECTAKLVYRCQPGAIAESFVDISALMFKAYLNKLEVNWLLGDEITQETEDKIALKFVDNPPRDGLSIDCTTDYECQDPHISSGVYNKAFFNLATTEKWDQRSAYKLFFRALKYYWSPLTGFDEGLCAILSAAEDLNMRLNDIKVAFAKVGVFCGCPLSWITRTTSPNNEEHDHTVSSCYKIVNINATWAEAKTYCGVIHAKLAGLQTEDKTQWLYQQLDSDVEYWVGGVDLLNEGEWRWTATDNIAAWTQWFPGQPVNDVSYENCVSVKYSVEDQTWSWYDDRCSQRRAFVCEMSCCGTRCNKD